MFGYEENLKMARALAAAVAGAGGRVYYVGGFVRDRLRGQASKDVDVEVHGVGVAVLEGILDTLGERISMGESFGIYNLRHYGVDIAMPRKEKLRGRGHRDFDVFVDPFIGPEKAARRRDFTVNALMQDVLTGEVLDFFGGQADLAAGILRHVDDATFSEDPLRVLRCAQFAARFGFSVAPETAALCRRIPLDALSKERIAGELDKALLKAERPSVFFETLRAFGALSFWFPETQALVDVPQDPRYHAEGDVWNHTLMVLDAAAAERAAALKPRYFMYAALCHDLGKPFCTERRADGRITSIGHETAGLAPARALVSRLSGERRLLDYVLNMTELHMRPYTLAYGNSAVKKTNALFDRSLCPEDLLLLAAADDAGRIALSPPPPGADAFLRERLRLYREVMSQPPVSGRDLLDAGLRPDRDFSALLAYAHKLRLAGIGHDDALRQTLAYARELKRETQRAKKEP